MLKYFSIILLMVVFACTKPKAALEVYFDLGSLLDEQAIGLLASQAKLEKKISIGDQSETQIFSPDSTQWVEQFELLKDFSPSSSLYVGAFEVTKLENEEVYLPKDSLKTPLKYFSVSENMEGRVITAESQVEKGIYSDNKKMRIVFKRGVMDGYTVTGYQKMMLKDTLRYTIEAKVISQ
ncbi:MAG: hypothetical protein ACJA08_000319 [Cyclobacteriaceae bacterium]|jgi:hypothetical protein